MGIWFQCTDCIFGSNSRKQAHIHTTDNTTHTVKEEQD